MGQRHQADLMILGADIVCMDAERRVIQDGALAVSGEEILWIGPRADMPNEISARRVIEAEGKVVIPGMINAHSHLAMTLFRGFVEDLELEQWLQKVWKYELSALDEQSVVAGFKLALAEMLHAGVTCAHDMYWHFESTMALAEEVGFRLLSGPPMTDIGGQSVEDLVAEARSVLGRAESYQAVRPIIQAHSVYTTSAEMLSAVRALKEEYGLIFTTHTSETHKEVQEAKALHGKTPIELLESHGLLDKRTVLAHCVHLEPQDIDILEQTGTHVAHCPESNLKLGSGIAPIAALLERGINVCLGTDGPASNNDLDLLGEMRTAALLQKGHRMDPQTLTTGDVLAMATCNGAKAYGLETMLGSLEPGKKADLVILDFKRANLMPRHDVCASIIYSAGRDSVETVLIGGRIMVEEGALIAFDEEPVLSEVAEIARRFI